MPTLIERHDQAVAAAEAQKTALGRKKSTTKLISRGGKKSNKLDKSSKSSSNDLYDDESYDFEGEIYSRDDDTSRASTGAGNISGIDEV